MILGRPAIRGISLGSVVCIIFVGLLVSIGSYSSTGVALALPDVVKTIFFNIFIFALGVKIGPQFFAGLKRDGWHMVAIGAIVAVLAPAISYVFGWLFDLPPGAVAGLLAGSNNSSATFGTASSALSSSAYRPPPGVPVENVAGMLSASFALCYAATQVQFVLFMKLLPRLAGFDAPKAAHEFEAAMRGERTAPLPGTVEAADAIDASIAVRAYRVPESGMAGKTIGDVGKAAPGVAIELVRRGTDWIALDDTTALAAGDEVVISGPVDKQVRVREVLGPEVPDAEARALRPLHTVDVVIGRDEAAGRSVPDLLGPGLYPNAVFRAGIELPAGAATTLAKGDVIRVTGTERASTILGSRVGQVVRAGHTSDVLTLALGLLAGALLGAIPVPLFGIQHQFRRGRGAHDGNRVRLVQDAASRIRRADLRGRPESHGGDGAERLHVSARDQLGPRGLPGRDHRADLAAADRLSGHQPAPRTRRLGGGTSRAQAESGTADGCRCRRPPEHHLDASGAKGITVRRAWHRIPGPARDHHDRPLGGGLLLRAIPLMASPALMAAHAHPEPSSLPPIRSTPTTTSTPASR